MRFWGRRLVGVVVATGCMGCESSKKLPSVQEAESIGQVEWAIGPVRGSTGFSEVECEPEAHGIKIRLRGIQTLRGHDFSARPDVLIAKFPEGHRSDAEFPDYGVSVFLPNLELDGRTYPMIQLVAQAMPGVPKNVRCELKDGSPKVLTCQHARVMPWLSPTEVPEGAFRVELVCP
jgi:hypothetical protein